jgi:hypothetical protein
VTLDELDLLIHPGTRTNLLRYDRLGLEGANLPGTVDPGGDDMNRRDFLAGMIGTGTALVASRSGLLDESARLPRGHDRHRHGAGCFKIRVARTRWWRGLVGSA